MSKATETETDKKQIVIDLQKRLDWLSRQANEEEYNEAEVQAIKGLLHIMAPGEADGNHPGSDNVVDRFWQTAASREEIYTEICKLQEGESNVADRPEEVVAKHAAIDGNVALGTEVESGNDKEKNGNMDTKKNISRNKRLVFRNKGLYKGIIAAALVLVLSVGGTAGVYAEKKGFFHWLKKDESGVEVITSPESLDNSMQSGRHYATLEEVPERYRDYIWVPEQIPRDMEFRHFEVLELDSWDWVAGLYEQKEEDIRLEIICRIFSPKLRFFMHQYDSYEFMYTKKYGNKEIEFLTKKSDDGEVEYAASFWAANVRYIVQGNIEIEEIEKLAEEYCKFIENNL